MIDRGKHNLLGIRVSAVDYEAAVQAILVAAHAARPLGVSALAVHGVMTGVTDPHHRYRLNQLEMIVPDGQPVRVGLNLLHRTQLAERVYGPQLMLEVCRAAAEQRLPICLFGGTSELLEKLTERLHSKFPELKIAAAIPSKFRKLTPAEKDDLVETIKNSGAKIVFCGLGCPRQEVWAFEFKDALAMPILAVGAAFNFHAGLLKQAPAWMQRSGLEWFYRFLQEPVRLWRRYLFLNPYYLFLLACQWSRLRNFDPHDSAPPSEELRYG